MSKLGFNLPDDLEQRLRRHVAWGNKSKVIEGLLRMMVENFEGGSSYFYDVAMEAYWRAHK